MELVDAVTAAGQPAPILGVITVHDVGDMCVERSWWMLSQLPANLLLFAQNTSLVSGNVQYSLSCTV